MNWVAMFPGQGSQEPGMGSELLDKYSDYLNEEFKNLILIRFNSLCQAMYNSVKNLERTMKILDTYGDNWVEEHNRIVTEY